MRLLIVMLLLVPRPAPASPPCDVVLAEFGAHQTLRSNQDASRAVAQYLRSHGEAVTPSDFQEGVLSADGSTALIVTDRGFLVWSVKEKRLVRDVIKASPEIAPALTPDGSRALGMIRENEFAVWDVASGNVVSQFRFRVGERPYEISPDGSLLLVEKTKERPKADSLASPAKVEVLVANLTKMAGLDRSELTLYDIKSGKPITRLRDHESKLRNAYFANDGRWIATTSEEGLVRCENTATGELMVSYGIGAKPDMISFSPDGKTLLVVSRRGSGMTIPIDGSNRPTPLSPVWGIIYGGAFSPASNQVLALNTDSGFHLMDIKTNRARVSITGLENTFGQLRFSSDGNFFSLSLKDGKRFVVWDAKTVRPLYELKGKGSAGTSGFSYSEAGGVIGASYSMDALKIWETSKMPTLAFPDAKSFATADGVYRFYREEQPDTSVVIKVKRR